MKDCVKVIVTDNSNIFYTDCNGSKKYNAQQKDSIIEINVTQPFSNNLSIFDLTSTKRSFWGYIKSDLWVYISVFTIACLIGITSYIEGSLFMTGFMLFTLATLMLASFIDWKRRG